MRGRTLGDLIEWIAAVLAVAGGYAWLGLPLALFLAAASLAYFAQVEAATPIKRLQLKVRLRRRAVPVPRLPAGKPSFNCTTCDYTGPADVEHVCPAL